MGRYFTNALDAAAVLSYSVLAISSAGFVSGESGPRDAIFFYTLRLSLPLLLYGERAGETCAGEVSKSS